MKKVSKLLIVLLSLAVIVAALVIVSSASSGNSAKIGDKEYETLEEALRAAKDGDEIVLISDAFIDTSYKVDKSVSIDLGGHTLDACSNAFNVTGDITFTVKGNGKIYASGIFVSTYKGNDAVPTVGIIGDAYGIDVEASSGIFTSSRNGNLKFKNLNVTAGPTPNNKGVFHNEVDSDARFEFVAVEVIAPEGAANYSSIIRFGNETYAKIDYCHFSTNRVVFSLNDCKTTALTIEASNSYFAAKVKQSGTGNKYHEIGVIGTYAAISCKMEFTGCVLEGSFRPVCVNATPEALLTLNNSAIKNNGVQGADIVRTCNIVVNAGSMITTVSTPSAGIAHSTSEDDKTYVILMEGARMNKSIYEALYVKGNNYGVRYGTEVIAEDGSKSYELEALTDNVNFTVIYDPMGNAEAPYVVVKRTYEDGVETTPAGDSLGNIVYTNNYAGFPVGVIWENGKSGPYSVGSGAPNNSYLGWNKNGILSGAQFGGNGALRYTFDEPNADGKNGTTILFDGSGKSYAHNEYQVFVAEADFAFDGEFYAAGTLSVCGRGANNGGNYSSDSKISITADGKAAFGDKTVDLKYGEWNHATIVVYTDKNVTGTSSKGTAYYYVNGELMGTGNGYKVLTSNGDIAFIWGLRYDVNSVNEVGATILFDNTYMAAYTDYMGGASDDPIGYSATAGQPINTEKVGANITVGGLPMGNVNDAITLGNELGVYPQLKGNLINQEVTVNGTVRSNGYTIQSTENSNAAIVRYNDASATYTYNFNSKYNALKVTYQWFIGNKNSIDDLKNPEMYVQSTVSVGKIPEYNGEELTAITEHIGQDIYTSEHIGWSADLNATTPDELAAVSVSDAVNMADSSIKLFPVYSKELTKVTGYGMIILDVNGNFSRGINPNNDIYGSDWTTRAGKAIKLDYGETLVLMSSKYRFIGNFNSPRTDNGNPKTFAIDLNGYTMNINGNKNSTGKTPNYFQVKEGETFYFYSSVPGAVVNVESTNESVSTANGGKLFSVNGSGLNTIADNISDETNHNTHLKVGTVNRFGKTYSGKNLTINGDTLVELTNGDKTCSVEIEDITFVKTINSNGSVIVNAYFNGSITVKNSNFFMPNGGTFIDGKSWGITDVNGDGKKDKSDVDTPDAVRVAATAVIDGCYIFMASNGTSDSKGNVSNGDYTYKSITYTNCVTNGRIGGSNTGLAIRIGDNCLVYTPSAQRLDGVDKALYNRDMTIADTGLETITVKYVSAISGSGTSAKYTYTEFTYAVPGANTTGADLTLPYFQYKFVSAENTYTVTYVDGNGEEIKSEAYAKGALPILPENVSDITDGVAFIKTFNGTFSPELPSGVVADETLTANYDVKENIEGLKANLSLDQDFKINLMIPAIYKDVITSVKVGDTELDVIETADYLVVSVPVAAKDASDVFEFVVSVSENGTDVTKAFEYGIVEYAEEILENAEAKYTASDRKLIWYVVNYAAEAALYLEGEADEALEALLETYADAAGETAERTYAGVIEQLDLSSVFNSATIRLTEVPAYVFSVKAGFEGTVTVTTSAGSYVFEIEASDTQTKLVIEGMKAYELAETAAVSAEGTIAGEAVVLADGTYNLATYANYHSQNAANSTASAEALDLINALYAYVTEASIYANK